MKNNFIKSTIILILGGFFSKVLGMIIKIILTRTISVQGIGFYSMILPTFNLFITLCSLGMPIAISKLVSEKKKRSKRIILSIIPLAMLFNLFLIVVLFLVAPFLSHSLLNNPILYYPIVCIGFTLPFICISSILKGYFFGKEKMFPTTLSNIIEQLVRLFLTFTVISKLVEYSLIYAICGVVLINIFSEGLSIIVLLLFLPKGKHLSFKDFSYDKEIFHDLMGISIPTTGSRLIGSISFFLEPIILTYALSKVGYSKDFITTQYGIINGYVYPLLLLPSFFTLAISSALLPVVTNFYSRNQYSYTKYKIKQAIFISLLIGIPCTFIFMFFPQYLLNFIYHTNKGIIYIKMIAPVFILFYVQGPLTTAMQAMNQAKRAMMGTLYGSLIRIILLFVLSLFQIGIWGLVIAECVNIIFITLHHFYFVFKAL